MDAATYLKETERTWQVDGLTWREQIANAAFGLAGELGEFTKEPSVDELGDCFYYAATLCRLLKDGSPLVSDWPHEPTESVDRRAARREACQTIGHVLELQEALKKHLFHDRKTAHALARGYLAAVVNGLRYCAATLGKTQAEVMQQNIDKLRERHPDGWDPQYTTGGEL